MTPEDLFPGAKCLTGNASDPSQNVPKTPTSKWARGGYAWFRARTNSFDIPNIVEPTNVLVETDESVRAGGWFRFSEGRLTDGFSASRVGVPNFTAGFLGRDLEVDLGGDCAVQGIVIEENEVYVRNIHLDVWVSAQSRWVHAWSLYDAVEETMSFVPKPMSSASIGVLGRPRRMAIRIAFDARKLRLRLVTDGFRGGLRELQVWGAYRTAAPRATRPAMLSSGVVVLAETATEPPVWQALGQVPLAYGGTPIPVVGQPFVPTAAPFFTPPVLIGWTGAGLADVAALLSEDLTRERGVACTVSGPVADPDSFVGIMLTLDPAIAGAEGTYRLAVSGSRAHISAATARGVFYGTQTLHQLLGADLQLATQTVTDTPVTTWRELYMAGRPESVGFIRALARFKVNKVRFNIVHVLSNPLSWSATVAEAARRFVELIPIVDYRGAILGSSGVSPLTEDAPSVTTTIKANACPGAEEVWTHFQGRLAVVPAQTSWIDINFDEMHLEGDGGRWNVDARCRHRTDMDTLWGDAPPGPADPVARLTDTQLLAWTLRRVYREFEQAGRPPTVYLGDTMFRDPRWSDIVTQLTTGLYSPFTAAEDPTGQRQLGVWVWAGGSTTSLLTLQQTLGDRLTCVAINTTPDWADSGPLNPLVAPFRGACLNQSDAALRESDIIRFAQRAWSGQILDVALAAGGATLTWQSTIQNAVKVQGALDAFQDLKGAHISPEAIIRLGGTPFPVDLSTVDNQDLSGPDSPFSDISYDLGALSGPQQYGSVPWQAVAGRQAGQPERGVMVHNRLFYKATRPTSVSIPFAPNGAPVKADALLIVLTTDSRHQQEYILNEQLCGFIHVQYDDGLVSPFALRSGMETCPIMGPNNFWSSTVGLLLERAGLAWASKVAVPESPHYTSSDGTPHFLVGAFLYACAWINPRPERQVVGFRLSSPTMPTSVQPILVAATRIELPPSVTLDRTVRPQLWTEYPKLRRGEDLTGLATRGTRFPLEQGRPISPPTAGPWSTWQTVWSDTWEDATGTVRITRDEACRGWKTYEDMHNEVQGGETSFGRVANLMQDNRQGIRTGQVLPTTLPALQNQLGVRVQLNPPRSLTGLRYAGYYMDEAYSGMSNIGPGACHVEVAARFPGDNTWYRVDRRVNYIPEEDPLVWVDLEDRVVSELRLRVQQVGADNWGLSLLELWGGTSATVGVNPFLSPSAAAAIWTDATQPPSDVSGIGSLPLRGSIGGRTDVVVIAGSHGGSSYQVDLTQAAPGGTDGVEIDVLLWHDESPRIVLSGGGRDVSLSLVSIPENAAPAESYWYVDRFRWVRLTWVRQAGVWTQTLTPEGGAPQVTNPPTTMTGATQFKLNGGGSAMAVHRLRVLVNGAWVDVA
jgi:hypothetical protein